jgi:TRAP-type C4-dicarboxylate transport system permease small subunit
VLKVLAQIERLFDVVAVILIASIMVIATADVAMRYVFNSPFSWTYDLISMYLMVALFYLVLSSTFADNGHIRVDLFSRHMPPTVQRAFEILIDLSALGLFLMITYAGASRGLAAYQSQDVAAGYIPWPTWPSIAMVPIGAGLMVIRMLLHILAHAMTLVSGIEGVPLPSATGEAADLENRSNS